MARARLQATGADAPVTALELFFDLVFVYALTQVTALMTVELSAASVGRGLLALAIVWWAWVAYSWIGNVLRADEGATRAAFIAVMGAMFLLALALPGAFATAAEGIDAGVVVGACYAFARLVHLAMFTAFARVGADRALAIQLAKFGAVTLASSALVLAGGIAGGSTQIALWAAGIAVDYVGTQVIGAGGWRLPAPRHFSERHGLIVLIALGESIVAIGVGAAGVPLRWPLLAAALLGIALVASLWWVYFDVTALGSERRLAALDGPERSRLARDGYSYIHLVLIAGIVIAAVGLKKAVGYASGVDDHAWDEALHGVPLLALHGGPALFLLGLVAFRLRMIGSLARARLAAAGLLLAAIPAGGALGALVALALVVLLVVALVAYELVRYGDDRARIRHAAH